MVSPELDPSHLLDLVEMNGLDLIRALLQVSLGIQHVIGRNVAAIKQTKWMQTTVSTRRNDDEGFSSYRTFT